MLCKTRTLVLCFCLVLLSRAQAQNIQSGKHSITVTGVAEREVLPDEIYVKVVLKERYEGRDKIDVSAQEVQMIAIFKELGICDSCYSLSDIDQQYMKVKTFKKDAITTKTYEIKVTNAAMTSIVLEKLEEMKIMEASIDRMEYSKKKQLIKELEIEAIRTAKTKATYVLESINENIGKPILINVDANEAQPVYVAYKSYKKVFKEAAAETDVPVEFKKIKFASLVNAEFEIK